MNTSFSIYSQFKSKVDKLGLGLCVSSARCWGMHRATKLSLQDTDLKNPGWPRPKTKERQAASRTKTKYQDQSLRPKIKTKVRPKSESKTKESQTTRTKTKDEG